MSLPKYKAVLFDLDGTLIDSVEGIIKSNQYAFERLGYPVPTAEELRWVVGPPLREIAKRVLKTENSELIEQYVAAYRERYATTGLYECSVYPGIENMLASLKERGCKLLVATSKPAEYAQKILAHHKLNYYFKHICGPDMAGHPKDKAGVIELARNKVKHTNLDCMMVGDRHHDIDGANFHKMSSIGILWGAGSREELENAKATYLAKAPEDVVKFISN